MRATGEVMGIDTTFGLAFAKSQTAAGNRLPESGSVFFSLADRDKLQGLAAALRFVELGFSIAATPGTAAHLEENGVPVETVVAKVGEESPEHANAVELIASGKVRLVVNTPRGRGPRPAQRKRTSGGRPTCTRLRASPPSPPPAPRPPALPIEVATHCPSAVSRSSTPTARGNWRCEPRVVGLTS